MKKIHNFLMETFAGTENLRFNVRPLFAKRLAFRSILKTLPIVPASDIQGQSVDLLILTTPEVINSCSDYLLELDEHLSFCVEKDCLHVGRLGAGGRSVKIRRVGRATFEMKEQYCPD